MPSHSLDAVDEGSVVEGSPVPRFSAAAFANHTYPVCSFTCFLYITGGCALIQIWWLRLIQIAVFCVTYIHAHTSYHSQHRTADVPGIS